MKKGIYVHDRYAGAWVLDRDYGNRLIEVKMKHRRTGSNEVKAMACGMTGETNPYGRC